MASQVPHITPAELDVMKVLWRLGAATVRQVQETLAADGGQPAYTTVMTMLKNLADKGALAVDRDRQPFVYSPLVSRDQVLRQRVADFLGSVFDGRAADLVLHLAREGEVSAADLRRIEARVDAHERDGERETEP